MRALLLALCLLLAAPAHAALPRPLPQEVATLQTSLAKAEAAQTQLAERITAQQQTNAAALKQRFRLTTLQLRLASWPQGLLLTHAVLTGAPAPATTLTQTLHRQTTARLAQVTASLATLTGLQQQAQSQLDHLQALQTEFATANGRLSKMEKSALAAARTDADTLAAILTQNLSSSTQTIPPATLPALTNTNRLPVAGRLEIAFNETLPGGGHSEGLTFRAAPGSPVTSVTDGTVLYAGPFRNLGGLVIIRTGSNRHMVYGGLSTLAVSANQQVQPQTVLGTLPETPPARLYLEVRQRGHTIDPATILAATD